MDLSAKEREISYKCYWYFEEFTNTAIAARQCLCMVVGCLWCYFVSENYLPFHGWKLSCTDFGSPKPLFYSFHLFSYVTSVCLTWHLASRDCTLSTCTKRCRMELGYHFKLREMKNWFILQLNNFVMLVLQNHCFGTVYNYYHKSRCYLVSYSTPPTSVHLSRLFEFLDTN